MNTKRKNMTIPVPKYHTGEDYETLEGGICNFDDIAYSYDQETWLYFEGRANPITEKEVEELIPDSERYRVERCREVAYDRTEQIFREVGLI